MKQKMPDKRGRQDTSASWAWHGAEEAAEWLMRQGREAGAQGAQVTRADR